MFRETTDTATFTKSREMYKRRAVRVVRTALAAVPELGDSSAFLQTDRVVQDAVATLVAMSFGTELIATLVNHERFTPRVAENIIKHYTIRAMCGLIAATQTRAIPDFTPTSKGFLRG